jgi:hypothetical protein
MVKPILQQRKGEAHHAEEEFHYRTLFPALIRNGSDFLGLFEYTCQTVEF